MCTSYRLSGHLRTAPTATPLTGPQARVPDFKSAISRAAGADGDLLLQHGDTIRFGGYALECRATPGHTDGCMSYYLAAAGWVFTGDALLIRGCGRTDFQQGGFACPAAWNLAARLPSCMVLVLRALCGSVRCLLQRGRLEASVTSELAICHERAVTFPQLPALLPMRPAGNSNTLYDSVYNQIFSLPDDTLVYPGHDYKGLTCSSVAEEKAHNPRLSRSREGFVEFMANLGLAYPKQIDRALPANLKDGAGL